MKREKSNKVGLSPNGRYKVFVASPDGGDDDVSHNVDRRSMLARVRRAQARGLSVTVMEDIDAVELFTWDPPGF